MDTRTGHQSSRGGGHMATGMDIWTDGQMDRWMNERFRERASAMSLSNQIRSDILIQYGLRGRLCLLVYAPPTPLVGIKTGVGGRFKQIQYLDIFLEGFVRDGLA